MIALDGVDSPALADLTREELIELVEQQRERGIRISFSARQTLAAWLGASVR